VALLGRPNAGKSTLLNALLGEKLAIVTDKPQTTRSRILGIQTRPGAQLLFVDTPGLHASERTFNASLNDQAQEAADGADVALLLVDLARGFDAEHARWLARWRERGVEGMVVGTKLDLPGAREAAWPPAEAPDALRVSARDGEGRNRAGAPSSLGCYLPTRRCRSTIQSPSRPFALAVRPRCSERRCTRECLASSRGGRFTDVQWRRRAFPIRVDEMADPRLRVWRGYDRRRRRIPRQNRGSHFDG
jgi:small GTP-binding protein